MKPAGYEECYEKVKKAVMKKTINATELAEIRDRYGYFLYIECLRDVKRDYQKN